MQDVQDEYRSGGLRERKRAQTHARIQAAALALFSDRGFEATTLDDIAVAADVSRRTLFHYFRSKEDIILSSKAGVSDSLDAAIARRPADEPMLAMAEHAMVDMSSDYQGAGPKALARLIGQTPTLHSGDQAKYETMERRLAAALAARKGLASDDLHARMVAVAAIGAFKIATEAWLASEDDSGPDVYGKAAFAALRRTLAE